jgi:acyl-CoA reductase-like NAD-dependent aldehyde dehydrogenase
MLWRKLANLHREVCGSGFVEWAMSDNAEFHLVVWGEPRQVNPLDAPPSVTGVLGAGNTEILNDIVDPLCRLNSVVVYKSNPVMVRSNQVKELILAPLIERGYVGFVYGGAEEGQLVVESDAVDRVFLTGSHQTYDRIVWGGKDKTDPSVEPMIKKPVLAELGSVNPYLVVPGDAAWTAAEVEAQADALVAYKLMNASHICASPQVLITCRHWPQRKQFLDALRRKVATAPKTRCFYPGIEKSYHKHLMGIGASSPMDDPWHPVFCEDLLADGVDANVQVQGLQDEAFSPVLYEVAIDSDPSLEPFMARAVEFCHGHCWGNLSCTIVVDDRTRANHREELDCALDSMRFGTIGVNCPPALANSYPFLPWGGFPGNDPRDVQSGIGQVGNFCSYENVQKSIIFQRFRNLQSFSLASSDLEKRLAAARARAIAGVAAKASKLRFAKVAYRQFRAAPSKLGLSSMVRRRL